MLLTRNLNSRNHPTCPKAGHVSYYDCVTDYVMPTSCVDGAVRLSGESSYRGRLEICRNKVWGTVCAAGGFSTNDANVACRMLGQQPLGKLARCIVWHNPLAYVYREYYIYYEYNKNEPPHVY